MGVDVTNKINVVLLYCPTRNGYYGVGTHLGNLIDFLLSKHDLNVTIVRTDDSHVKEIDISFLGERHTIISIPQAEHKVALSNFDDLVQKIYASRIVDILDLYLNRKENLLFMVNSVDYLNVCAALKERFEDSKIFYIHHAWSWKYVMNISDSAFAEFWKRNQGDISIIPIRLTRFQVNIAALSNTVVTVTNNARRLFEEPLGIESKKIKVIYNGINSRQPIKESKNMLRLKYGFSGKDRIVIFSGRIQKEKGAHYLFKAFKMLCQRRDDLRLIVVGDGEFDELIPLLNPFWNRVVFTGLVEYAQLSELYSLSDVGVLPSLFEQCSYTAIEMRFHRLPIVVSAVDGLDELFEQAVDALKIKVYEDDFGYRILRESEIVESIEQILDNPKLRNDLIKESFKKAKKLFDINKMHEMYYGEIKKAFYSDN